MPEASENTEPDAIDEWRVDVAGPAASASAAPPARGSEAKGRSTRVRRELEAWRSELDERVRQLEERLRGSGG